MTKIVAQYFAETHPPILKLSIYQAPHRRQDFPILTEYRRDLYEAIRQVVPVPIDHPIDLHVMFIEPISPDLGGSYLALEQCLDGATLEPATAVLVDDSLLSQVTMSKYYPYTKGHKK